MTQRERFLAMLVGGTLLGVVVWWGLGKYQTALKKRNNEITNLEQRQQQLTEQQLQGEYANRQMGEYLVRSLPGNPEVAQSRYQKWLLAIMQDNDLTEPSVDPTSSRAIADLYQQFSFSVKGKLDTPDLFSLLHDFYSRDYLHRIRTMSIRPGTGDKFMLDMNIDVIGLLAASPDSPEPSSQSWQIADGKEIYAEEILNRNFFEPPNDAPKFSGSSSVQAIIGRRTTAPLVFKDSENHTLRYELAEAPEDKVSISGRSGTLSIQTDVKEDFEVLVRVSDDGYPRRSVEQKIIVKVVDPPSPPAPEPPKLKFDDAKQTVLTALVGRDEYTAWMHVRTRDQTLKLRVGDAFEIGTLKGKVVEVTRRYAVLAVDGGQFELRLAGNLSEASKNATPIESSSAETAEMTDAEGSKESVQEENADESEMAAVSSPTQEETPDDAENAAPETTEPVQDSEQSVEAESADLAK